MAFLEIWDNQDFDLRDQMNELSMKSYSPIVNLWVGDPDERNETCSSKTEFEERDESILKSTFSKIWTHDSAGRTKVK